jgi:hypothetical protein
MSGQTLVLVVAEDRILRGGHVQWLQHTGWQALAAHDADHRTTRLLTPTSFTS